MATTSLWSIRGNVTAVIKYIKNPKKTTLPAGILPEVVAESENIETVLSLVDSINCSVKNAAKDMNTLKEYYGKTGGITAYHGYQSFSPEDDITPLQAHKIGMELAQALWGDRLQVVVATHLDKENHIHNHFVINTVPIDGSNKFCRTKQDYMDMRGYSDALCMKYGLTIIYPDGKKRNYGEYKADLDGKPTIRSTIRMDIDRAIAAAGINNNFFDNMKKLGYEIYLYSSSGEPLVHPKLKPYGTQKCFRFDKLGDGYDIPDIKERLRSPDREYCRLFPQPPKRIRHNYRCHKPRTVYSTYKYYGRFMRLHISRPGYVRRVPYYLREDIAKFERFVEKQNFMSAHRFESLADVVAYAASLQDKISFLTKQKQDLYIRASHEEKQGSEAYAHLYRMAAKDKYAEIRSLRKELRFCKEITGEYEKLMAKCMGLRNEVTLERNELIKQRQRVQVR